MSEEQFYCLNVAEHDRYGKGSVMVWAGISVNGKTDLYVVENGTLTAVRYCNKILDQFVRPYADAIGPEFILMDDYARNYIPQGDMFYYRPLRNVIFIYCKL